MSRRWTIENDLALLELIRVHMRGDGSGDEVATALETWSDDERFVAVQALIAHVVSMASELADNRGLATLDLVDEWEASAQQNERYRRKLMGEDSE